ncbi:universal stress protein [Frigidibacter albus]|uniref:Universal stress protein n=1 Tax=Frigidibacter albus TaxID=1465486 RepID=A0A6L8VK62_9RHOB|nr:universal stress protein [Frigidibacter albus]MZQ90757.1 universal stress protein [Frigidibacter albus]NBE32625.1 universal stress protein [Frigidibacter albus]GGH61014.1 universal stress protein UspA [Frigidibacter albus]
MTNKILALVDGSAYSHSVCHYTAWIAGRLSASVDLLHVLGRREGSAGGDLSGALKLGARSALLEQLAAQDAQNAKLAQAKGRAILEDAAMIIEADGAGPVTQRLRQGDLLQTVSELEPEIRAIVIGKRGEASGFASDHLGSNLERIVRSSKVPVFVASRVFKPVTRVLVAFDASASTQRAIARMVDSVVFRDTSVMLVHAGEETTAMRTRMEEAELALRAVGLKTAAEFAPGEPEAALNAKIAEQGFDLLVMGAYGHSRIRSLIIGSTTTAMIQAVKIPLVLYR